MPWLSSAALVHGRRAPQADGLRINLDRAARDPSIKLERFLVELASRTRREKPTRANACWRHVPEC